jgi:threonine dehydrogenase-like Zn-dependent dehydrogenase
MGSTGDPSGQSGLAPRGSVTSPRREAGGRVLQPRTTSARLCPVCTRRRTSHCSGWRVLLTANADAAEAAVPGSFAATYPPAEAPADGGRLAAPAATAGARSRLARHHHF